MTNKREVPWCIPLPAIAGYQTFAPVRHILTAVDATVPQQLMDLAREHYHRFHFGNLLGTRYLHAFGQPFELPLDRVNNAFAVVGKDRVAYAKLKNILSFHTGSPHPGDSEPLERHFPVSATVICCFEPSSLQEHSGKRVVVLRVLRSLEWDPIRPNASYTGPPIPPELYPQAGQLLMTFRYRKPRVWAANVDRSGWKRSNTAAPFAILFENALEYGSSA
ncbi:hypothetical protein K466DRAFT_77949 [Polyporus arcularius HHB13444]|uniref:Uncharacterized protein n=1 Tax=Polyporus arcularius HHB13444 TaxID=1314778 RepID=A0A5C3NMK4_9APHY|nr:hypothetical protein K466DRAFT_77949 [Polyporus arcularius HHB13444]